MRNLKEIGRQEKRFAAAQEKAVAMTAESSRMEAEARQMLKEVSRWLLTWFRREDFKRFRPMIFKPLAVLAISRNLPLSRSRLHV